MLTEGFFEAPLSPPLNSRARWREAGGKGGTSEEIFKLSVTAGLEAGLTPEGLGEAGRHSAEEHLQSPANEAAAFTANGQPRIKRPICET